jgi:hypothetical protein
MFLVSVHLLFPNYLDGLMDRTVNYTEIAFPPNRAKKAKLEAIVELIRAKPGISLGEINREVKQHPHPQSAQRLTAVLTSLCLSGRIRYEDVHRYFPVSEEGK